MLSWDEFDRELRDEYDSYSSRRQHDKCSITEISLSDSIAVRRAKAALDALAAAEDLATVDSANYEGELTRYAVIRRWDGPYVKTECQGTYTLYDFQDDHARKADLRTLVNKIVTIVAAYLLSSISCSLATAALNAKLRTPLFAYDAELSIDRHRLRTAF